MDYAGLADRLLANPPAAVNNPENDAMVLACKNQPYFQSRLQVVRPPFAVNHRSHGAGSLFAAGGH